MIGTAQMKKPKTQVDPAAQVMLWLVGVVFILSSPTIYHAFAAFALLVITWKVMECT